MNRPTVEVADIVQAQGARFVDSHRDQISYQQLKVLRAIARCRTAALGGHIDDCPRCGHKAISYNSCRNRHCPKCQAQARQRWLAAREKELLGVPYFHLVFTLPHELIPLCQRNPRVLYNLLFRASAATMLDVAADPKHLGAEIGFLSILHTWGQNLLAHPHVHCVIPAGGLSPDHTRWVHPKYPFFLPVKVLSRVFRGKFVDGLKRAYRRKNLQFPRASAALEEPKLFLRFLRTLFREDWVVYAKPAFGGAPQVLRYLGRYTHRVAISNHRLLAFDGERVTFRWKDYAHGNKQRKMTLAATEFLRRFLQHVLPRGFVRIRHFGFLANSCRTARLSVSRRLLAVTPKPREPCVRLDSDGGAWRCPRCGGAMRIGPNLTATQLAARCCFFDSS
jgi:Putative transposase/Transposase zinc-binding domain